MDKISIIVPESWNDITVEQYDELMQLDMSSQTIVNLLNILKSNNYILLSSVDHKKVTAFLSIILDIAEDIVKKIALPDLINILETLNWLKPLEYKNSTKNFNKTQVGLFIDLENIIEKDLKLNMIKFLNKIEGRDTSCEPITQHFNTFNGYLTWRKKVYEDFSGLFEDKSDDDDIDMKNSSDIMRTNFNKKWNWYGFIYTLANGDILKMEAVTELNMIGALNFLSYEKEKSILK